MAILLSVSVSVLPPPLTTRWVLPETDEVLAQAAPEALATMRAIIGPPAPYNTVAPGFVIVGDELRLDIGSLPPAI